MPPRPAPRVEMPAQRTRPPATVQLARRRASSAALRRRRILAGLLVTTLVVAVATPLSPLPAWSPLVGLGLMIAFLVHVRLQIRAGHVVTRSRDAARRRSRSRLLRFDALERLRTVRRELAEERAAEDRRWQEAEEAEARLRAEEEERRAAAEAGWNPVPVPLPTYVTKPPAPRRAPPIDLTNPGAWTAAQTAGQAAAQPTGPVGEPVPEQRPQHATGSPMSALLDSAFGADEELDSILDRRAVND
jgi:hypothetical protein